MFQVIINSNSTWYRLSEDSRFSVINVDGLAPPTVAVNTSTNAGDGAFFNSAYVQPRNIVITIVLNGDIETSRKALYDIFPIKKSLEFVFVNKNRGVQITGYVESINIPLFSQRQQAQVSIICPSAWFRDYTIRTQNFTRVDNSYLTKTVENSGDIDMGVGIFGNFAGSAAGFTLTYVTTGETFSVSYVFQNGDTMYINTKQGELTAWVRRSGVVTSLLPYISNTSRWIKLQRGTNELRITMSTGLANTSARVTWAALFGGV